MAQILVPGARPARGVAAADRARGVLSRALTPAVVIAVTTAVSAAVLSPVTVASARSGHSRGGGGAEPAQPWQSAWAYFNNPAGPGWQQRTIGDQLESLIDGTRKGATIRLTTYSFSDKGVASKLVKAHRRGVHVRVVAEERKKLSLWRTLQKELGTKRTRKSFATLCQGGCLGKETKYSVLHAKIALFSATGRSSRVALVESGNPTSEQQEHGANDAYRMEGDKKIYDGLRDYFSAMTASGRRPAYRESFSSGAFEVRLFPKPKGANPVLKVLDDVSCWGGTEVTAVMYQFNRSDVAKALWGLDDEGCRVRVVYTSIDTLGKEQRHPAGPWLRKRSRHGGIELYSSASSYRSNGKRQKTFGHHKFLLIDGGFRGRMWQKVVVTGSLNWTTAAIRNNDEVMLTAINRYGEFWGYSNRARSFMD